MKKYFVLCIVLFLGQTSHAMYRKIGRLRALLSNQALQAATTQPHKLTQLHTSDNTQSKRLSACKCARIQANAGLAVAQIGIPTNLALGTYLMSTIPMYHAPLPNLAIASMALVSSAICHGAIQTAKKELIELNKEIEILEHNE